MNKLVLKISKLCFVFIFLILEQFIDAHQEEKIKFEDSRMLETLCENLDENFKFDLQPVKRKKKNVAAAKAAFIGILNLVGVAAIQQSEGTLKESVIITIGNRLVRRIGTAGFSNIQANLTKFLTVFINNLKHGFPGNSIENLKNTLLSSARKINPRLPVKPFSLNIKSALQKIKKSNGPNAVLFEQVFFHIGKAISALDD